MANGGLIKRTVVTTDHVERRHHHARRAEAALQAVMLLEGRLHGMQIATGRDPLDRGDRRSRGLDGQDRTALDRLAVHVNDAGSALRGVAAHMRSRQTKFLANEMHEQGAILALSAHCPAIHRQCHFSHVVPPRVSPGHRGYGVSFM